MPASHIMVKRFQNKISESRFLLATVAVITVLAWFVSGRLDGDTAASLGVTAMTAYFLVELDTRNSVIRIYSRMIPASFLVLSTMTALFTETGFAATAFLFTLFLMFLFASYQDKTAADKVFYAFMCMGIASVLFVQILFMVPLMWFLMLNNLMSMGRRTFAASIMGVLVPYWFIGGYLLMKGDLSFFAEHFSQILYFGMPFDFSAFSTPQWVAFVLPVLLSATGMVHYLRSSNRDKIRTRMFLETISATNLMVIVFILLQPVHFVQLLPVLVVTASVLVSHFIVLTDTKVTNRAVAGIIAVVAAATIFNLWNS